MAATIDFHGPKSKYFLSPDFSSISLSDEEPISKALDIVLRAKKKSVLPAERDILVKNISSFAKGDNIGCLRKLKDFEWEQLDIPLICRIFLKHLIMQSCSLTPQQTLECDFNSGLKYNWHSVQLQVTQILSMGFSRNEALEAIMVTNNKQIELAAQYLLSDQETQKLEYQRAKKQKNQSVAPNHHWTIIEQIQRERDQELEWKKNSENELLLKIQKLKHKLNRMRTKRKDLENKRDEMATSSQLILYKEYIHGLIAGEKINALALHHMDRYKTQRKITKQQHLNILQSLGYDNNTFDKLKMYENITNNDECVVCYDGLKDHMIRPCNHVCLCGDCVEEHFYAPYHHTMKCPLCSGAIQSIKRVYYS